MKRNIALTGMMGSGKSSVSQELSKLLPDYNLVDIDSEIEKSTNKKISEIFLKFGKNTQNPEILNYQGLFAMDEMKFIDAIKDFSKASSIDKTNPVYLYNLANAYFLNGSYHPIAHWSGDCCFGRKRGLVVPEREDEYPGRTYDRCKLGVAAFAAVVRYQFGEYTLQRMYHRARADVGVCLYRSA